MHKTTTFDSRARRRLSAGLAPWRAGIAPLMSLAHLILEAGFNFLPVTYALLIPKLSLGYGQIGVTVLLMTIAGTITQPIFGWLSDRSDPRRIVVASLLWGGTLMGLVGFMPTYGALTALVVLAALGSAAFHPPAAALSSATEAANRGRALSLFSVGGNLGAALSPVIVGVFLSRSGLGATAVLIPLSLTTGLLMARRMRVVSPPRRPDRAAHAGAGHAGSFAALLAMVLVVGARSYFQQALMTYLPEWLRTHGQSLALAGAALSLFMVAVSVGSLFGGSLSDRVGRLPVIMVSLALMGAGHWLLLRTTGAPQMGAVLLIGLMIGASFPVTIVLAQEAWPQSVGFASAMVMGIGWLPAGLGAWVVGQVADASTLTAGLRTLTLAPAAGLAFAALYALLHRRKSLISEHPAGR